MKVINVGPRLQTDKKSDLVERLQQTVGLSSQQKEAKAQEVLIAALRKSLNNRYILLRSVQLEGLDFPIPLTLVGPTGIYVIHASPLKGLFRVKEDSWENLDEGARKHPSGHPNLLVSAWNMSQTLRSYLNAHNFTVETVEPILFFSDPGLHVDTVRPAVRILMTDALDRFIAGLLQNPPVLTSETVKRISTLLSGDPKAQAGQADKAKRNDAFSFREELDEKKRTEDLQTVRSRGTELMNRIPLTNRQLAILGGLTFALVLLISAVLIVVWYLFLT